LKFIRILYIHTLAFPKKIENRRKNNIPAALRGVGEDLARSDGFAGDVAAERVVIVVVEVAGVTTCRRLIPISSTSFRETIDEEEEEFVCCGGLR